MSDPGSNREAAEDAFEQVADLLLRQRLPSGWWAGELSTSALSTATAVMALQQACRHHETFRQTSGLSKSPATAAPKSPIDREPLPDTVTPGCEFSPKDQDPLPRYRKLIDGGLAWLASHQNDDGGWGDTVLSVSNISTSMLAHAVFHATGQIDRYSETVDRSTAYIDQCGGVDAVLQRYGKDHTFSIPILTHCALAEQVDWTRVIPLPFELSCVPARWYAAVKMPVVSYALPALIAIGQVIFRRRGHWNPLIRWLRQRSIRRSLKVLKSIQPENGGFLEATPLTSFVCMSLLGCDYDRHDLRTRDAWIVIDRCLAFIEASVRPDGSWPIDTNLTTWVTTLSVNALGGRTQFSETDCHHIRQWLLRQQYCDVHPYTNSPPGGWSWTDLPGGVPDADDTPGAMLAILNLRAEGEAFSQEELAALERAAQWLLDLQNSDGGWPTFCRGWGTLPFDRSSNDLTAHVLRALSLWRKRVPAHEGAQVARRVPDALRRGLRFLKTHQRDDGSWLPLWFGNQFNHDDENPLYGTAKVILALVEIGQSDTQTARRGIQWLVDNQNDDGGWSGELGLPSSVEETSLAVEALADVRDVPKAAEAVKLGIAWLTVRIRNGTIDQPAPIGFYFAKLWYFERLYPIIFSAAALNRYVRRHSSGKPD